MGQFPRWKKMMSEGKEQLATWVEGLTPDELDFVEHTLRTRFLEHPDGSIDIGDLQHLLSMYQDARDAESRDGPATLARRADI